MPDLLYVGKFPLEKKETLVSSLVFMSRTFLIASHSFLWPEKYCLCFLPFHLFIRQVSADVYAGGTLRWAPRSEQADELWS